MLSYLIIGIAFILGGYFIVRWWVQADIQQILKMLRWSGAIIGIVLLCIIAISGRWNWLPGLLFMGIPWLIRNQARRTINKNANGPTTGQKSQISTYYLRMELDHDSGEMSGEVITGKYSGLNLGDLNLNQLIELMNECVRDDQQSRIVLENYMDRNHSVWRNKAGESFKEKSDHTNSNSPWNSDVMSLDEACKILDISPKASKGDIEKAYRKAMKKAHPDNGGSDWMAAKVNQAKDSLLDN